MAVADRELSIVLRVVNGELMNGITAATGAVQKFAKDSVGALDQVEERAENMAHVWKGLFEAFIGVEIVNTLKKIADAANDAAEKLDIAARTAKNFGHSFDPGQMEKWLEQFSSSVAGGGFALPDMRQSVQTFSAIGLDPEQTKRALADTANLSAAFGLSFPEATHIATEALTGHVEMLTRYGIISREQAKNIHTNEEAMRALENASKGAAEERANGLAGAFGRLGNAANNLGNAFGAQLIPYFTAVANGLDHLAQAFTSLPAWVQQAAAGLAFFTTALTAIGLMLPAVKLAFEFMGNAIGLIAIPLRVALDAFVALYTDIIGPILGAIGSLIARFIALALEGVEPAAQAILGFSLKTLVGTLGGALEQAGAALGRFALMLLAPLAPIAEGIAGFVAWAAAGVAAMIAPALPILALIAALALIGFAIYEVVKHWDGFKSGAVAALNWVGDRIKDFVNFAKDQFEHLGTVLSGVWEFLTGNKQQGLADMKSGLGGIAAGWKGVGEAAMEAGKKGFDAVNGWLQSQGWFRSIENSIKGFFAGTTTKAPAIPTEAFSGGVPGGKGGAAKNAQSAAQGAAENAFKNFDEATKNWLDTFQARINVAQAMVDQSRAHLDTYSATLPGGKPQTAQEEAKYQSLLNAELQAEQALRAATLAKHEAEVKAAERFAQIAKEVSPHLKNHDALVRSALDAVRQHGDEALKLKTTYEQIGVTLAQIAAQERDIHDQTIEDLADARVQADRMGYDARQNTRDAQSEGVNNARTEATIAHGGTLPKVQDDQYTIQLARIADAAAKDNEALLQHAAAIAADTARQTKLKADADKATQAQNAATSATNARVTADNALNRAIDQFTADLKARKTALGTALDELVKKLNVPGLTPNAATGGFSFSPMGFLIEAFSQTKAFADIMATVNQIVKVFAQLLDNLRPVIDIVLAAVRAVANVFIFLYNTVARILRLFGIHLQLLDSINSAYSQQIPLIQVTHNIPTLNELAAGKLGSPLSNTPVGSDSLQNIGNMHTTLLQSILGAVLALVAVETLMGHGGGIFGSLAGLFGHGAASGGDSSLQGAYSALQTIPGNSSDVIAQGTQAALAADGTSASGGLFSAVNNGMKSASPYLATALAGMLGSSIGGGGQMAGILSGIGGIAGTIFGGPVGGAIGSFLGGIIGGLFGHHSAPAPKRNTQTTEFTAMLHAATDVHAWMNGLTTQATSMLASASVAATSLMGAAQSLKSAAGALSTNGLTTQAGNMLSSVGLAAGSLIGAAQSLNKAASALGTAGSSNTFVHSPRFDNIHIHDDRDIDDLDRDLANRQMRQFRSFQFAIDRGPIG